MLRSTKSTILCTALALFTLVGGHAWAQGRASAQPKQASADVPGMGEAGILLEFARTEPEFREALKSDNAEKLRKVLANYGLSDMLKVYDNPLETIVPLGPYSGCTYRYITVYTNWPHDPRTIRLLVCNNSAGGLTSFGWPM